MTFMTFAYILCHFMKKFENSGILWHFMILWHSGRPVIVGRNDKYKQTKKKEKLKLVFSESNKHWYGTGSKVSTCCKKVASVTRYKILSH